MNPQGVAASSHRPAPVIRGAGCPLAPGGAKMPEYLMVRCWLIIAGMVVLHGCGGGAPAPDLRSPEPARTIPAMRLVVERPTEADLAVLVQHLRSHDAAVRLYAIASLKRIAGDDLGYHYFAAEPDRLHAVERWERWLKQRGSSPSPVAAGEQGTAQEGRE